MKYEDEKGIYDTVRKSKLIDKGNKWLKNFPFSINFDFLSVS